VLLFKRVAAVVGALFATPAPAEMNGTLRIGVLNGQSTRLPLSYIRAVQRSWLSRRAVPAGRMS
jgi:hypothetical protein